jgi:hypothetical protein
VRATPFFVREFITKVLMPAAFSDRVALFLNGDGVKVLDPIGPATAEKKFANRPPIGAATVTEAVTMIN